MTACPADLPASRRPRLVVVNPDAPRAPMPLRELERRLAQVEQELRGTASDAGLRAAILRRRRLLRTILGIRLARPEEARRLEQMLRWQMPGRQTACPGDGVPGSPPLSRLLLRLLAGLSVFRMAPADIHGTAGI